MKPKDVAQYHKAGRGYIITRNSATLLDTDYEHVARETVAALNYALALRAQVAELTAVLERIGEGMVMPQDGRSFSHAETVHEYQRIARAALAKVRA